MCDFWISHLKLHHTKFQDERMTRTIFITKNKFKMADYTLEHPFQSNFQISITLEPQGAEGWNFQRLIISTLSTNSDKMNKIWLVRVSCHSLDTLTWNYSYSSKFHVNMITGSGVMAIFVYEGLTRNQEIGNTPIWVFLNIWILGGS